MNTKHTKGPWRVEEIGWVTSDGRFVKSHPHVDIYPPRDLPQGSMIPVAKQVQPNDAILIAAAPELLDALRWALDQIEDDLDPDHQAALSAAQNLVNKLSEVQS